MTPETNTPKNTPLIPLAENDGSVAVMGRDLHSFLEITTPYNKWSERMIEYGFSQGEDFQTFLSESSGGRPATDHVMKLDMAKEISMIQRNDKGKQARQYFIEVEKQAKTMAPALTNEEIMARAVILADSKIKALESTTVEQAAQLEAAAPKVEYHDTYVADEDLIQFRTLANQLGVGEQEMRKALADHGWIYNDRTQRWSNKENSLVWESRWRANAGKKKYFRLVAHHKAPRINGEVRQTLKVTPHGATAIAKALRKWSVLEY